MFLIIFDWCLCDFLVLKHIDEVYALFIFICHWLMFTYFMCRKCSRYFNIVFDYLLILTIFHVQIVLIIFDWCLCDFLVLKHIDEVYTLHLHLSLTDVDIFICGKYSNISVVCLIINWCWLFFMCKMFSIIFNWRLCDFLVLKHIDKVYILHFQLMFMWFSCTETHQWSVCTSSSFVIDWCWHFYLWKIF